MYVCRYLLNGNILFDYAKSFEKLRGSQCIESLLINLPTKYQITFFFEVTYSKGKRKPITKGPLSVHLAVCLSVRPSVTRLYILNPDS